MSKILIATNHSYMLYRFRLELIQALQKEHEVVLSMPFVGHEEDFQALGLRCVETPIARRGINPVTDLGLMLRYWKLLRREKPDLVLTISIKPNVYGGMVCRMLGIPYCSHVQGLGTAFQSKIIGTIATVLYRIGLRRAKTVFFENASNVQTFLERKIADEKRVCLLPGAGINLKNNPCHEYPKTEPVRFLYLGRIMKEKGMDELFTAVRRLRMSHPKQFHLDLVGFFEDAYKEQVEQLEREGVATFHGFQENPEPFYGASHCVVLPSYHEGLSNVLLEAAAAGRPVITCDIPGCRETVDEGLSGLLCKSRDADSLYEKMAQFLSMAPDIRAQMGLAGRQKVEREFDKAHVVKLTLQNLPVQVSEKIHV